ERSELLRKLFQCAGLRHAVAAILYRCGMGSVHERFLGLVSGFWLYLGVFVSLGMDALPLWFLGKRSGLRMGMATRRFKSGMEYGSESYQSSAAVHAAQAAGNVSAQHDRGAAGTRCDLARIWQQGCNPWRLCWS